MDTPKPVDVNRFKAIAGSFKKIVQKADELKPIVLSETTQKQTEIESIEESMVEKTAPARDYSDEQVMNSRLPESVKKAMIDRRVPKLTSPPSKFSIEDFEKDEKDIPMIPNKRAPITKAPVIKAPIRENITPNSDLITVSKSELDAMINAKLLEFLTKSYNKTLTEETIARTINMLIKEGKISVKKKEF